MGKTIKSVSATKSINCRSENGRIDASFKVNLVERLYESDENISPPLNGKELRRLEKGSPIDSSVTIIKIFVVA